LAAALRIHGDNRNLRGASGRKSNKNGKIDDGNGKI
jgi:hypothetical protein